MKPYYEADGIVIFHGDCREILPELREIPSLVLTDPPYGMDLDTDNSGTGDSKRAPGRAWESRVTGDDAPFDPAHLLVFPRLILWGANHYASRLPESNGWFVWNKRGDGRPSGMHFGDCELAWSNVGQGIRMFSNVWHGAPRWRAEAVLHPTQKPVVLMSWLLQQFTEPGDLVLDPYMGSGPVARACLDLDRRYVGIEIEERYCEIAAQRLGQMVLDVESAA